MKELAGKIEKVVSEFNGETLKTRAGKQYKRYTVDGIDFNDFDGKFKDFKEGDSVVVAYEQNGNFCNVQSVREYKPEEMTIKSEKPSEPINEAALGLACNLAQRSLGELSQPEYFETYKDRVKKFYETNLEILEELR